LQQLQIAGDAAAEAAAEAAADGSFSSNARDFCVPVKGTAPRLSTKESSEGNGPAPVLVLVLPVALVTVLVPARVLALVPASTTS
jgi:hypothetical protein